jgi:hypothetical protein
MTQTLTITYRLQETLHLHAPRRPEKHPAQLHKCIMRVVSIRVRLIELLQHGSTV